MIANYISIILMLLCAQVNAKDFGVVGEVFPIMEKSFLELIHERLKALQENGDIEALNQHWTNTVASHINRPKALGLERANASKKHDYRPEVILNQDIVDHKGRVLYTKGTTINALQQMPAYNPCWLFFNADDLAQLNWAQRQKKTCSNPKFILTGGTIKEAENKLQAIIYFDQAGRITNKLSISHVPAKVVREKNHLAIFEEAIKENGDVV